jgi:zinc and cadmium transporter
VLPVVLALAAASFLYIAIAGLIPLLHGRTGLRAGLAQSTLIAAGGGAVLLGHFFSHGH